MTEPEATSSLTLPLTGPLLAPGFGGEAARLPRFGAPRGPGGRGPGEPPAGPQPRRAAPARPLWRRPWFVALSLLLHGALLGLLLLPGRQKPAEPLPPPSIDMVFDGGTGAAQDSSATPLGGETGTPAPPPGATEAPSLPEAPRPLAPPPPPLVSPPPQAAVPLPPQAPPAPAVLPSPPLTAAPPPPAPAPLAALPPPPPPPAPSEPRQSEPAPTRPAPTRNPFPNTLDLTQIPPQALAPRPAPPRRQENTPMDLSLGPAMPRGNAPNQGSASGQANLDPNFRVRGARLGADWRAAFHDWLRRNARYPLQAAMAGEDGPVTVRFTVTREGQVTGVQLINRSGSQWLDYNTTGLLRGAQLPPFPEGTTDQQATIDLTINYVLIRR